MYIDFIDKFNQYIWPKYPYLENITFVYFGNIKTMNIMTAFMTQTLFDLIVYANHLLKDYENELINNNDIIDKYNYIQSIYTKFSSDLSNKLDDLIIKYIKNYDSKISNIQQFINRYKDNYNYLHRMIDKIIDNL